MLRGTDGIIGKFEYIIEHINEGPISYRDRYSLKIKEFTFDFKLDDRIIEPGEVGFISSLTYINEGPMPTPIH